MPVRYFQRLFRRQTPLLPVVAVAAVALGVVAGPAPLRAGVGTGLVTDTWSGDGDWSDTSHWSLTALPTALHLAQISAGSVTISSAQTIGALSLSGGVLTGAGQLTLTAAGSTWSGGNFNGTGPLQIQAAASFTISGSVDHDFNQRTINSAGEIDWTGGSLRSGNGGALNIASGSVFNDAASGRISADYGGTLVVTNSGTYNKTAAGTTLLDTTFNNDTGTINVSAGTLQFRGGGTMSGGSMNTSAGAGVQWSSNYTISNSVALRGAGTYTLSGGVLTVNGTLNASNFTQTGGELAGTQTLTGGIFEWIGGDWNAAAAGPVTTIDPKGTLNLRDTDTSGLTFNYRSITNQGTVNWYGAYLEGGNGSIFTNAAGATFNDLNTAGYRILNGFGGTFTFENYGTYNRTAANSTTYFDAPFNNHGTVNVQSGDLQLRQGGTLDTGSTINASAGTHVYFTNDYSSNDSATLAGPGAFALTGGTFTATGNLTLSNFTQSGGTLAGAPTILGNYTWSGGNWNASGPIPVTRIESGGTGPTGTGLGLTTLYTTTIASGSVLAIAADADSTRDFNYRNIVNQGTVNWTGGYIRGGNGSVFTNAAGGTFNDNNASGFSIYNGFGGSFTFENDGTYTRNATNSTTGIGTTFYNTGTVNVVAGTLQLSGGGELTSTSQINTGTGAVTQFTNDLTIDDSAKLAGAGSYLLSGGVLTATGNFIVSNLTQTGGRLAGTETIFGNYTWQGGDWNSSGSTTIAAGSTLALQDNTSNTRDFNLRAITNQGTVNWYAGYIRSGSGGSFTNAAGAVFNDFNTQGYTINQDYGGGFVFTNNGTYNRNAASTSYIDTTFNNNATVNVLQGDLQIRGGGTLSDFATMSAAAGTNLYFTNGYNVGTGTSLTGAGHFWITGGIFTVNGSLAASSLTQTAGELAGTHTLTGTYNWQAGDWNASGTGASTTIGATGTLNLNGTSAHDFNDRLITNRGVTNWTLGYLRSGSGGTFDNATGGTFNDLQTDGYTINADYGGGATFVNDGTYIRNATGTTVVQTAFNNNGLIDVRQGTLAFNGGGTMSATGQANVLTGANLIFQNSYTILDGAKFSGTGNIQQTGGTLAINGTLSAPTFLWSGGDWNAANASGLVTTIGTGTTLVLTDANSSLRDFSGRTITNQGIVNWNNGYFRSGNGGQFINAAGGVFNDQTFQGYTINRDYGGSFTFTNNGTYVRNGANTSYIQTTFDNNGAVNLQKGDLQITAGGTESAAGTMTVASGTNLYFTNGYNTGDGASLLGAGNIWLTNGTFTATGKLNLGNFTQTGGEFAGTSTLAGTYNWSGGDWNTSAIGPSTTISATGTLNLASGSTQDFNFRTISNSGTVNWTSGYIRSGGGGQFINAAGGTFNDLETSGYTINNPFGGTFAFTNQGTYLRNATGTTVTQTTFNNDGLIDVRLGTLAFNGGGTMSATSQANVLAGANLIFENNYTILDGARFSGAGNIQQVAGTLAINGTLNASTFLWSGGDWNTANDSGLTTTIGSGTTLVMTDATTNTRDFTGRTITNLGIINWSSGYIRSGGGGRFVIGAGGVFNDLQTAGYTINNPFGGAFTFTNSGTYVRNAAGVTEFDAPFVNDGLLRLLTGDLRFAGGGTMTANSVVNGNTGTHVLFTGDYTLADGSQFTGPGNYQQQAGTLTINGKLTASAFEWAGGNWNVGDGSLPTTTIAATTTLNLDDSQSNVKDFIGRTISNTGTVNWYSAYLRSGGGGQFVNAAGGTFNDLQTAGYRITNPFGGAYSFTNNGTYVRNSTGAITYIDVPFNNNGLVSLQTGDLALNGGGTMSSTGVVTGVAGTHLYFTNDYTLGDGAKFVGSGLYAQTGGTLTINGNLTAIAFEWAGGNWNVGDGSLPTTTIAPTTTLNVDDSQNNVKDFVGRIISNAGTVNWYSGYLRSGSGGQFVNAAGGTFNDLQTAGYTINNPVGGAYSFTNNGTYFRNASGTTYLDVPFNNNGLVSLQTGNVALRAGGTMSASGVVSGLAGTQFLIASDYTLADGARFTGPGTYKQTGGTLTLNGTLNASTFYWSGGNWNTAANSGLVTTIGTGTILVINADTDNTRDFTGREIDNNGTINWTSGYIRGASGSSFVNNGTLSILDSSGYTINNPFGGTFTVTNEGMIVRNSANSTSVDVPFVNDRGTVSLSGGGMRFSAGFTQNTGSLVLANNASFDVSSGGATSAGRISGSGTMYGHISSSGTIAPGTTTSTGKLTLFGDLSLLGSTSNVAFKLGGTDAGTGFDQLLVSGSASLNGLLNVGFTNGFQSVVQSTDTFTLIGTSTALSGSFLNVGNGQRLFTYDGLGSFQVNYGPGSVFAPSSVVLSNFAAVPEPSTWALMGVGLGAVVVVGWRRRKKKS